MLNFTFAYDLLLHQNGYHNPLPDFSAIIYYEAFMFLTPLLIKPSFVKWGEGAWNHRTLPKICHRLYHAFKKKIKKIPVHCTSQCFSLCTEYTAYWVNSRKVDLRVTKHHNVVSTTVDISLLHDDLPGDHPTVGCREVDFTLESCFDDWVLCLQNLIGTWVKLRHQDVHIICIHRIGTLGCCSLKLHVS